MQPPQRWPQAARPGIPRLRAGAAHLGGMPQLPLMPAPYPQSHPFAWFPLNGQRHAINKRLGSPRAHTQALNALQETQLEQGQEITDLRAELRPGFARQDRRIDGLDREMREGFATVTTGMAQITALLTNLGRSEGLE